MHISELDTPALVIDLDIMERNLRRVGDYCKEHGLRLRPHTKTHKVPAVGRRQLDSGAVGLTVAKVGEAEVMLGANPPDLLVAYPVIGRSKLEDIEMDDDAKPPNAHIALNVIEDEDGTELKIVRHNMPFGEIGKGEFGTYFIGYSRNATVTERMLSNMFIGDPPGNTDRILDFSTAVTGGKFFTPIVDFLDDPPPLADSQPEEEPVVTVAPIATNGSLGIGSLKGTRQ